MYLRCFTSSSPSKWIDWLSWAEYCYNTSYHTSLKSTPFETVYGRPPPRLLSYLHGSSSIEAVDTVLRQRDDMLHLLRQNLLQAQNKMKATYDQSHRSLEFKVGDMVLLRLKAYRQQSVAKRTNHKLSARFYGPFRVLECIGTMAYKLDLPAESKIHPVFHVSYLKPYHAGQPVTPTLPPTILLEDPVHPLAVLDHRIKGGIPEVLIHWSHSSPADASWERVQHITDKFPDFKLADKLPLGAGSNVTKPLQVYSRYTHGPKSKSPEGIPPFSYFLVVSGRLFLHIEVVLLELNSEADTQANLAVNLKGKDLQAGYVSNDETVNTISDGTLSGNSFVKFWQLTLKKTAKSKISFSHVTKLRSVEEETQIPEEEQPQPQEQEQEPVQEGPEQQTVSVPVSPSDTLTMFFQAEGTMNETAIPTVTNALEEIDDITNLKVQVLEGIASVEVISTEEEIFQEKAPAPAPVKSYDHHAPQKAPYPPENSHHPPQKAPAPAKSNAPEKAPQPPKKVPAPSPSKVPPVHYTGPPSKAPYPQRKHQPQKSLTPRRRLLSLQRRFQLLPQAKFPQSITVTSPSKAPSPVEHGCVNLCEKRCKTHRRKRPCMRACTECCAKCKCVPPGTSGADVAKWIKAEDCEFTMRGFNSRAAMSSLDEEEEVGPSKMIKRRKLSATATAQVNVNRV
ncbi:hypothetical protein GH714_011003 [Hevea brasiliensis]|uniref:Tf2-1-like SH3-like domain-containing protein n=1 Tax=Hevea brasiliensis TaxID=3981 RepID=A0A6A6M4N3_HEVBR|nr:hypothetical protein GH714_011003 [Hevea brasiliensis]